MWNLKKDNIKDKMKSGKVGALIIFIIWAGVFIWLNSSSLKHNEVIQKSLKNNQIISKRETALVSRVVDGDTIKVLIQNKEDTVRLIGIDAPETVDPKKPTQCFGKEASDKAKEMLSGKSIILESESTQDNRDEYGRLLRYVFLRDGTNFDKFMISEGYAREYTFKGKAYKYQLEFIQTEEKTKIEKKGLWGC